MERILCLLPIPTLIRASTVCKLWYSIISSSTFSSSSSSSSLHPWVFLYGLHNNSSKNHQSFAFDPISNLWFHLPSNTSFSNNKTTSAAGFLLTTAPTSPSPQSSLATFPPLPLYTTLASTLSSESSILATTTTDIEDRLAVKIYNPDLESWDIFAPLPSDFLLILVFSLIKMQILCVQY